MKTLFGEEAIASGIIPRDYQAQDVDTSFRLWDGGEIGTLTRCFTGGGKTIMTCLKFQRWLDRGPNYKCMALSYEQELVEQFAQEIADVLGEEPGVEMGAQELEPGNIPRIVVACRQSLLTHELATEEQREELAKFGFRDIGLLTKAKARQIFRALSQGVDLQAVGDAITEHNADYRCCHETGRVSRLHKFDWRFNWLVCMDEAHKYAMTMKTVGPLVEWFEKNPESRRSGVTATPKRRDKVSIGTKLFPAISLDYPFTKAVADGYAVPYTQKFVQVDSIDFKRLKEVCNTQEKFDKAIDEILNTEEELAKLCEPMLELVGDRKTLIFSPSVSMAENVADYINARNECECPSCGTKRWYPVLLLGDGAKCRECGDFITTANSIKKGMQAHSLNGAIPQRSRRAVYEGHKKGQFQFLSICGLCREGYNDPEISCVTIFRPVTKAASSLAEQMKGRGSRPARGCINGLNTVAERLSAIAASEKQTCLIIDLVGVTGLADCASTVQIYAEGLPDDIVARAEQIALKGGVDDPAAAVEQAKREDEEEKERLRIKREEEARKRREAAEKRATLDAEVKYSTHQVGSATYSSGLPGMASEKQLKYLHMLGIDFHDWEPSQRQAGRMITQLKEGGLRPEEVAYQNGVAVEHWSPARPTVRQIMALAKRGIDAKNMTPAQAGDAFAGKPVSKPAPASVAAGLRSTITNADTAGELTAAARAVATAFADRKITHPEYQTLIALGKEQRSKVF